MLQLKQSLGGVMGGLLKDPIKKCSRTIHPVYFKKTSAAPFGNRSAQLQGAWACSWADLQGLQGDPIKQRRDELRRKKILCLSAPSVKAPHFSRLLCWMGVPLVIQRTGPNGYLWRHISQPWISWLRRSSLPPHCSVGHLAYAGLTQFCLVCLSN